MTLKVTFAVETNLTPISPETQHTFINIAHRADPVR